MRRCVMLLSMLMLLSACRSGSPVERPADAILVDADTASLCADAPTDLLRVTDPPTKPDLVELRTDVTNIRADVTDVRTDATEVVLVDAVDIGLEVTLDLPAVLPDVDVVDVCVPNCAGKECGDDGCGGSCGECPGVGECVAGHCECDPDCEGKECGSDKCGGSCGQCGIEEECATGMCLPKGSECEDGNAVPWDGCTAGNQSETTVDTPCGGYAWSPVVVPSPDGYFVVWSATCNPDLSAIGESEIRGRFLSAAGTPQGGELLLAQDLPASPTMVEATPLSDGRYVIAWGGPETPGALTLGQPQYLLLDSSGLPLGSAETLESPPTTGCSCPTEYFQPFVSATGGGGFVAAWSENGGCDDCHSGIAAVVFAGDGTQSGPFWVFDIGTGGYFCSMFGPSLAFSPVSNTLMFTWTLWKECNKVVPFYPGAGGVLASSQALELPWTASAKIVSTWDGCHPRSPVSTALSDGSFLVSWGLMGAPCPPVSPGCVLARRLNAEVEPQGDEFDLCTWSKGHEVSTPSLAAMPGGGWVAGWSVMDDDWDVVVRGFTADGEAPDEEFRINVFRPGTQRNPAVACGGGTECAVAWKSFGNAVGAESGIFVRVLEF